MANDNTMELVQQFKAMDNDSLIRRYTTLVEERQSWQNAERHAFFRTTKQKFLERVLKWDEAVLLCAAEIHERLPKPKRSSIKKTKLSPVRKPKVVR